MRLSLVWLVLVLLVTGFETSPAQERPTRFQIESNAVGCVYDIEVVVPSGPAPPSGTYPVAYCLDWFILGDYLKSLPKLMALGRLTEPYMLVGIAQGSTAEDWVVARTRDFTPAHPTDEYSKSNMYAGAMDLTGGAGRFAAFLKDELLPRIESGYPADPSRRCLVGYSLGGLFGAHVLTEDPALFQYYIMGSPSLWFNDYYLAPILKNLSAEDLGPVKKVYVSVGGDESWEMLRSFDIVRSALRRDDLDSLKVEKEIIEGAGHVGAMPIALYNGFRFVFPRE